MSELSLPVTEDFRQRLIDVYGEIGAEWVERLPTLLAECGRRWSLTVQPSFTPLSYNYVAPAVRADGTEAVLKAGIAGDGLLREMEALRFLDGTGSVQLLEADADAGLMLLERLRPGTMLSSLTADVEATAIAAQVMRRFWRSPPAQHSFPSVADWAAGLRRLRERFDGGTGPLPATLVEQAERLFEELLGSMGEPVLLHGDLHHDNMLSAEREPWLAIDPKGVVGEREYEVGALLRNPRPQLLDLPDAGLVLTRRIDQLAAELGFDRERLRSWGIAQAVLSAWWHLEDHGRGWEFAIACAELLAGPSA